MDRLEKKRLARAKKIRLAEISAQLKAEPFWILVENGRLNPEEVAQLLGQSRTRELQAVRPTLFSRRAGALEDLAREAGFETPEAMCAELHERLVLRSESLSGTAELMCEAEFRSRGGTESLPLSQEIFSQYLEKSDQAVTRVVARMRLKTEREIERWVDNCRVPQVLIDSLASQRLEAMPMRQLRPAALNRRLEQALRKRQELLQSTRPEDLMAAISQGTEARVVSAMLGQARNAWKRLEELKRQAREIVRARPGSFGSMQTEALRLLLQNYNLGQMRSPVDYAYVRALPYLLEEIIKTENMDATLPAFPQWLLDGANPNGRRPYIGYIDTVSLTPAQLEDLSNLLSFLSKTGRESRKADLEAEQRYIEEAAQTCVAGMADLPDHPRQGANPVKNFARQLADRVFAQLDILLWQARKGDGMKNIMGKGQAGPLEELWQGLTQADERMRGWLDRLSRALEPHLAQLASAQKRLESRYGKCLQIRDARGEIVRPPASWRKAYNSSYYTPEMIFAMACHLGTKSNTSRLMGGYAGAGGLSPADLEAIFGSRLARRVAFDEQIADPALSSLERPGILTADDWRAIQGIWDALALLWPDTVATNKKMFGFAPRAVRASAFSVMGAEGETVHLQGGYFPVRYDGRISDRVGSWSEEEDLLARNEAMYVAPSARRGHTLARTEKNPGLPIRLDLSCIGQHVADAARFIEYAQLTRRFDRITRHKDFAAMYRQKFGREDYDMIRPNLRGLLRTEQVNDVISWLEHKIRKFVVPWGLSLNFNVALMQATAIFPAMGDLGFAPMRKSLAALIRRPSLRHDIWAASPYMKARMQNLDQDLVRQLDGFGAKRPASIRIGAREWNWNDVVSLGMSMISMVDGAASCAVWLGAYRKKLEELRNSGQIQNGQPASSPQNPPEQAGQSGQPGQTAQATQPGQPGQTGQLKQPAQTGQPDASNPQGQSVQTAAQDQPGPQGRPDAQSPQGQSVQLAAQGPDSFQNSGKPGSGMPNGALSSGSAFPISMSPGQSGAETLPGEKPEQFRQKGGPEPARSADSAAYSQPEGQGKQGPSPEDSLTANAEKPALFGPLLNGGQSGQDSSKDSSQSKRQGGSKDSGQDSGLALAASAAGTGQAASTGATGRAAPDAAAGQSLEDLQEKIRSQFSAAGRVMQRQNELTRAPRLGDLPGPSQKHGKSLVEFEDVWHEQAARFADMLVKQSNPDFDPSSRSSFLRSRGMMRLFNQFSSAVSLFASRHHYMHQAMARGRLSRAGYASHLAWDYLFPSMALFLLYGLLRDFHDEQNDSLANFMGLFLDQLSMTVPIFGGLASDWSQNLLGLGGGNYRRGDLRVSLDAPVELGRRASASIGKALRNEGGDAKKEALYALFDMLSFMSRVPVSKVVRKAERGHEQYRRGEGSPASLILPKGGK